MRTKKEVAPPFFGSAGGREEAESRAPNGAARPPGDARRARHLHARARVGQRTPAARAARAARVRRLHFQRLQFGRVRLRTAVPRQRTRLHRSQREGPMRSLAAGGKANPIRPCDVARLATHSQREEVGPEPAAAAVVSIAELSEPAQVAAVEPRAVLEVGRERDKPAAPTGRAPVDASRGEARRRVAAERPRPVVVVVAVGWRDDGLCAKARKGQIRERRRP